MSPLEQMQKAKDTKILKQQVGSLKKQEETLVVRIDPLQEAATKFAGVIMQR